jgi:crotonobetainyl-CoA:carnitine CoA-transferase CaiB-like acyl-CoA transferase
LQSVPHPLRPDFRALTNPIKLDGLRLPSRAASALGADTRAVLGDLGYDAATLDVLAAKQVI